MLLLKKIVKNTFYLIPRNLVHKFIYEKFIRFPKDHRRITKDFCFVQDFRRNEDELDQMVRKAYFEYVNNTSEAGTAISLEQAQFLFFMCRKVQPLAVLDTGSGFSSYVLRLYQQALVPECEVYSVDHDQYWMGKTGKFLESHRLSTENLVTWESFLKSSTPMFDLVFHDIDGMQNRLSMLKQVLTRVHSKSLVLLDDVHKSRYRQPLEIFLDDVGATVYDLKQYTCDGYGRYQWLITNASTAR